MLKGSFIIIHIFIGCYLWNDYNFFYMRSIKMTEYNLLVIPGILGTWVFFFHAVLVTEFNERRDSKWEDLNRSTTEVINDID